jgi:hypothetical protein
VDSDGILSNGRPLSELTSVMETNVIRPCLKTAFQEGELRRAETVAREHGGRMFPDPDYGPIVQLELETSAGDKATFMVWQPEVEQFTTLAGIRTNLLSQLEDWLPETQLHWGEEIHLAMPAGGAAG